MGDSIFRREVVDERERASMGRIVLVRPLSFTFLTTLFLGMAVHPEH